MSYTSSHETPLSKRWRSFISVKNVTVIFWFGTGKDMEEEK